MSEKAIKRTIVSALIISADNNVLFGKKDSQRGGVYLDKWHIPGGGVEDGEDQQTALLREIMEETGLDVSSATITFLDDLGTAIVPKKLPTGEVKPCQMDFHVYRVDLDSSAVSTPIKAGDDFSELIWVPVEKIAEYELTPPSVSLFLRLGWLTPTDALKQRQFSDANQEPVVLKDQQLSWRVSAYAVIIKDDQLLCIKNRREKLYDLIGGGVEFGETVEDALHREAIEEGGAKIKIGRLIDNSVDWFYHRRGTYHQTLQIFHEAELIGELTKPSDPDIEWVGWVPLEVIGEKYHFPPVVERIIKGRL